MSAPSAAAQAKPVADQIVQMLTDGNRRFVEGRPLHLNSDRDRLELAACADQGDHAVATILSCSDSRVPVERIFDAGIMDLFIVRVAGNVVSPMTAASLEYGALHVHTPIVMILGHTGCGAVTAAVARQDQGGGEGHAEDDIIACLLDRIDPCLERARDACTLPGATNVVDAAVEENIWLGFSELGKLSQPLREAVAKGRTRVLGAIYDLSTGLVSWLDADKAKAAVEGRL